ncbi:MAG TPA: flagellar assembly protein A, partial [Candidatus Obscuribacterales bacterium]
MEETDKAAEGREQQANGWVSIQNNALHVEDPRPPGKPAVISADDSVSVYVNDLPIHGPTDVFAHTHIRIQLPFRAYPEYDCEFEVAANLCAVDLTVRERTPGYFYSLPDTPAAEQLLIQAEAQAAPLSAFADDIVPEIVHELKARKISTGIFSERVQQALEQPGTPVRVVETQAPVSPVNRLDYLFALPEPDPLHPAGFSIAFPLLHVCKAGEVLVRRQRSDESAPGISIYGETLAPVKPEPAPLKASPDRTAVVNPDENEATARLEGIPSFNGREVRVGPLDRRSGVLEGGPGAFYDIKGSLQVDGSITSQAQILVSQHLEISGDVSHSHLEAQESAIIHGNTIRSQITAGGDAAARMRLR